METSSKRWWILVIVALCGVAAAVVLLVHVLNALQRPRIIFLDVGQGDAILLTSHGKQLLIDGGRDRQLLSHISKYMMPWDRTIELVVATHPDADHVGGIAELYDRYSISTLLISDSPGSTKLYESILLAAKESGTQIVSAQQGMKIQENFWNALVLWPDHGRPTGDDTNDRSIILRMNTDLGNKQYSLLLTGDASKLIESYLVHHYDPSLLDVDILKLGHHGSRTSSSDKFLQVTTPDTAIISAGCNNSYGHPHVEVLDILQKLAIPYLSTCTHGDIVFK